MDKKKLILLIGALVVAAVTALLAKNMFDGAAAPQAEAKKAEVMGEEVLVATRALPVGTIITPDAFQFQPWPKDLIEEAYFQKEGTDIAALNGTVVRNAITAGQPLTKGAIVSPGDRGFLAAALGPGMRAVTIPVTGLTGVAGFVFPGDRVDLMLTQSITGAGPEMKVSETVIRNLRVLATDNRVSATTDEEGQTVAQQAKLVTLEATPKIAEQISVAQTLGTLSLSLRSLADSSAELEEAIASGEIRLPKTDDPAEEARMIKSLAARPNSRKSTFSTGGDISRFETKTPPPAEAIPEKNKPEGPKVRVFSGSTQERVEFGD
ncbi:Flp pilus assembly protein CpaB [Parasphingorhabdus halotolerans]|uniref:Flp pilus assembly protein CpaB n=1 Tax=Parasphingorhabdus halotolerans TaxID=2725558 RepID=A0A6H2DLH8_9SPHN|nr:Flp pilus assembly protein CpaB [Parasphingorhabdus halotolerans]QJB69058.1 Flp pilus assembly protein CpaB [Parasphingorhabdus halotolerans]